MSYLFYLVRLSIQAFQGDNKWKNDLDCYAGGWGQAQSESGLGLSDRMKFAKVEILNPEECKRNIKNDGFLATMIKLDQNGAPTEDPTGEWPVICAGGFSDGEGGISNTAGGDSGLYFNFLPKFLVFLLKLFKAVDCIALIKIMNQHITSWEHYMAVTKMQQKIDICISVIMHIILIPRFKRLQNLLSM